MNNGKVISSGIGDQVYLGALGDKLGSDLSWEGVPVLVPGQSGSDDAVRVFGGGVLGGSLSVDNYKVVVVNEELVLRISGSLISSLEHSQSVVALNPCAEYPYSHIRVDCVLEGELSGKLNVEIIRVSEKTDGFY